MKFGELHYRRGVITYSISPYEVNAFAGAFSKGFPNLLRRFREKALIVTTRKIKYTWSFPFLAFVLGYLILNWADQENARTKRKAYQLEHGH